MSRFIIKGGQPVSGTFTPLGNKNAVLPMLAASVLTDQPVVLENVPWIEDVRVMLRLLEALGVDVTVYDRSVRLQAAGLQSRALDPQLCRRVRSSILLAGPMAARHGKVTLYPPGGDVIGRRRVDTHFAGLQALGIDARVGTSYALTRKRLQAADIVLDEASVTATENIMMAATLAPGRTTVYNAACEPHVQDLGTMLNAMGAQIEGLGTNRLIIIGVKQLRGVTHVVQPDHIEIGSFAAAAAVTGGTLKIRCGTALHDWELVDRGFRKLGAPWSLLRDRLQIKPRAGMRVVSDLGAAIPKVEDGPWPAFPSDLMSVAIVLATQAEGTVLFFEKMFESRMYFTDQLVSMGARIVQCDPHRVLISGPSRLQGSHMATPDIRAGMALLIAALCAKGTSVIESAAIIDRGYERIDERLRALGADIERVS
jgi:UDP-N-acetylglucosamine 1-carboxyvinyltransferase